MIQASAVPVPEETIVVITRGGQLRRMSQRVYEKMELPSNTGEVLQYVFNAMTDQTLLFFTQIGNCYQVPVVQLRNPAPARPRHGAGRSAEWFGGWRGLRQRAVDDVGWR